MLSCCEPKCIPDCSDWIIFILGIVVTVIWALILYSFRPELKIDKPSASKLVEKSNNSIIIPITNIKKRRKSTRLKVEVAVINLNNNTYHLNLAEDDFAFLAPEECREFKAFKLNEYLSQNLDLNFNEVVEMLNKPNYHLRVRVYATDSFSGLGETFEKCFISKNENWQNDGFIIKNC
jgi:hypothetical protein